LAYNAGDVEARLTLDRDPFTQGLRLARRQAAEFERKVIRPKIRLDITGVFPTLTRIRNSLNSLDQRVARPKVRIDATSVLSTILNINRRLTALNNRVVRPKVVIQTTGVAAANNSLNHVARTRTAQVNANVNRSSLGMAIGLIRGIGTAFTTASQIGTRALSAMGIVGSRAFNLISEGGASAIAGATALVGRIGGIAVVLGALASTAVAVFGAITFAIGGVTAALSSMPVLISAIALPIGAIALGFEGAEKAAAVLTDEIKHLRDTLASTLHDTMLPGFERLQTIFPPLEDGLNRIARQAGNFFTHMAEVITTEHNMRNLNRAIEGTLNFMNLMEGPLQSILQSMLDIAGTEPLYRILGETIGGVTTRIADMFNQMLRTNQLQEALEAMKPLLFSLTELFAGFATKALEFFINAAPGVKALFDGISAAVQNIDFRALGEAWGQIAAALGDIFKNIPKETWQDIVIAFQELANVLKDPDVQAGIIYLIKGIDDLIRTFTKIINIITDLIGWFDTADTKVVDLTNTFNGFAMDMRINWGGLWDWMLEKGRGALGWIVTFILDRLGITRLNFGQWGIDIRGIWDSLWSGLQRITGISMDDIRRGIDIGMSAIRTSFEIAVNVIRIAWDRLREIARGPVAFVVNVVYNSGIRPVWNGLAKVFGMPSLPEAHFAMGGVVPGYEPGVDSVHALLSRGEGVLVPEAVEGLGGPQFVHWANSYYSNGRARSTGGPKFAEGGIVDDFTKYAGIFTNPVATVRKLFSSVLNAVIPGTGQLSAALRKIGPMVVDKVIEKAKSFIANIGSMFAGGGGGAGVQRWMPVILQALGIAGQPASYAGITARRMNQESGGNPTIVNRWDVNWQRGTPSVGLMQVIGPTYRAYRHPAFDVGPYLYGVSVNPLSNILASMRYALSRYGSLPAAYNKAGGYDEGGVLPPGWTMAWNGTGQDEYVLTREQIASQGAGFTALLNDFIKVMSSHGGGTNVTVNANGDGQINRLVEDIVFALRHANKSVRV
jgi:hypothetical protein